MGLILRDSQCFTHGQLYVALSRVTSMEGIKIFSPNTCKGVGNNTIENVVYHELLDENNVNARARNDLHKNHIQHLYNAGISDESMEENEELSDSEFHPC